MDQSENDVSGQDPVDQVDAAAEPLRAMKAVVLHQTDGKPVEIGPGDPLPPLNARQVERLQLAGVLPRAKPAAPKLTPSRQAKRVTRQPANQRNTQGA